MRRVAAKAWYPASLLTVVVMIFVALGPPSGASSAAQLAEMAPPGADEGPYEAPVGAGTTEIEIAKQYETVRSYPESVDAYVLLGSAYLQHTRETGDPADYGRAEAAFDAALALEPENVDALIGLGVVALARHDFAGALELGRRAVALAPNSSRAHGVVVDALTELGRYDEAVGSAQLMIDLRPDVASLSRVSYQRELRGDIDGAITAMARAFDAAAGSSAENREYVRVIIGDLHLLKGDDATAEQIYRASLEVLPDFVWAKAGLARVAAAREDFAESARLYGSAVEILPVPELMIALGEAQAAAGDQDGAAGTFELVLAMRDLFVANDVNIDLEIALFEADHGDPQRALNLARQAYAAQPNVKAADALAWALHRAGLADEARRYSDEALRLGTPYPRLAYHAGMIALAAGDHDVARTHLERALTATGWLSPLEAAIARASLAP